jgi:hypothetical protein
VRSSALGGPDDQRKSLWAHYRLGLKQSGEQEDPSVRIGSKQRSGVARGSLLERRCHAVFSFFL